MSLCIGWAGDCPVHGDFHGCVKGDHRGREHRGECGARVAGFTAGRGSNGRSDRVNLHGSDAAWKRHIRAGEKPCEDCRLAHNEYVRLQKQRRRSA